MTCLYILLALEICDGAGYFEDSVVCASGKSERIYSALKDPFAVVVDTAELFDHARLKMGIGMNTF